MKLFYDRIRGREADQSERADAKERSREEPQREKAWSQVLRIRVGAGEAAPFGKRRRGATLGGVGGKG